MKEFKIVVEIDREGKINAETKGYSGPTCIHALDELFKDLVKFDSIQNTEEYYKKEISSGVVLVAGKGAKP